MNKHDAACGRKGTAAPFTLREPGHPRTSYHADRSWYALLLGPHRAPTLILPLKSVLSAPFDSSSQPYGADTGRLRTRSEVEVERNCHNVVRTRNGH